MSSFRHQRGQGRDRDEEPRNTFGLRKPQSQPGGRMGRMGQDRDSAPPRFGLDRPFGGPGRDSRDGRGTTGHSGSFRSPSAQTPSDLESDAFSDNVDDDASYEEDTSRDRERRRNPRDKSDKRGKTRGSLTRRLYDDEVIKSKQDKETAEVAEAAKKKEKKRKRATEIKLEKNIYLPLSVKVGDLANIVDIKLCKSDADVSLPTKGISDLIPTLYH